MIVRTIPGARVALLLTLSVITVLLGSFFYLAYWQYERTLINQEGLNQEKLTNIFSHSLSEYFKKMKLVTEFAATSPAFKPERTVKLDSLRYLKFYGDIKAMQRAGLIDTLLRASRPGSSASSRTPRNWQVFRGLPEKDSAGSIYALERRTLAQTARKTFEDLHYVFEMDINGDMVFLEPFAEQKHIANFNYSFRDYLKQVVQNKRTILSEGYISRDKDRTQIITVASPIFNERGEVVKLFAASVSGRTLRQQVFLPLTSGIVAKDSTKIYLLDHHGHIVASSSDEKVYHPTEGASTDYQDQGNVRNFGILRRLQWKPDTLEAGHEMTRETKTWELGREVKPMFDQYVNHEGVPVVGTFLPVPILEDSPTRWGILVETPSKYIKGNLVDFRRLSLISAGMLVLLLTPLVWFLFHSFRKVEHELKFKQNTIEEQEREIANVADRVSHDIRSPLVALDMLTQSLNQLPEDRRILIRIAVNRIQDIANDLITDERREWGLRSARSNSGATVVLMSSLLSNIVSLARTYYRPRRELSIESDIGPQSYGLFATVSPQELYRMLSNIINNAADATGKKGTIRVSLAGDDEFVRVTVMDDGVGIDANLIPQLGTYKIKSTKTGGKGRGLYDARRKIEELGGTLQIESKVGAGTKVRVSIPRATPPRWFVPEIVLYPGMQLIVVDDDQSIHQIWAERLARLEMPDELLRVQHFSSPVEFITHFNTAPPSQPRLFLLDYDYLNHEEEGLFVIESLGIAEDSILVTSQYDIKEVLQRAEHLGVKVLPKSMAPYVPIEMRARVDLPEDVARVLNSPNADVEAST
jgi:signal transduction histidine kinase